MADVLALSRSVEIPLAEIDLQAIRAQGAGGQNVNKVATAIHLRFDIARSSLPVRYKQALLAIRDRRLTKDGVIVIKSQEFRSQEMNRDAALARLQEIIEQAMAPKKSRRPTRPSLGAKRRRLDTKNRRGKVKTMRGKIRPE